MISQNALAQDALVPDTTTLVSPISEIEVSTEAAGVGHDVLPGSPDARSRAC